MKKKACYLIVLSMLLSTLFGSGFTLTAFGADEGFYSSFETADPAIVVQPEEHLGVSGQGVKTFNITGEYDLTLSSGPSGGTNEGPGNIVDKNSSTKWCSTSAALPLNFIVDAGSAVKPVAYYLRGANDDMSYTSRILNTWNVEGSSSASGPWTTLDSQSYMTWTSNRELKTFTIDPSTDYRYYRLNVTHRGNGTDRLTSTSTMQFSCFGLVSAYTVEGTDEVTEYLYPQTMVGNNGVLGGGITDKGWSGDKTLTVNGTKTGTDAKSYVTIYDNLNIEVDSNTELSYMMKPNQPTTSYDFEWSSMYFSVDLEFSNGKRLSEMEGAIDQYGTKMSPLAQGLSKVHNTAQWLRIISKIGSVANGLTINKIMIGYEKNGGTPNTRISADFDDIKIESVTDPVVTDFADYTNILRGTNNDSGFSRGLTVPAVTWPHGFNFWCPATELSGSDPYHYTASTQSFKHITISHEPSHWIGERGTFQFSADSTTTNQTGSALGTTLGGRGSIFHHNNEIARAYYYGVTFDINDAKAPGVKIEVTPTDHGSVIRYSFPANSAQRNIILDSTNSTGSNAGVTYSSGRTFTAFSTHSSNGMRRMHVAGEFNADPLGWNLGGTNGARGMFRFGPSTAPSVIELKVATSFYNTTQARKNLDHEISSSDNFDSVCARAKAVWNEKLSTVQQVEGATHEQLVTLYSNMYRGFMYPNNLGENTANVGETPVWRYASPYQGSNTSPTMVNGKMYYNNGFWDTYRTTWAAYALLTPEKDTELLNGLVAHFLDTGVNGIPRWIAPSGTNSMVGTSSDVIFGDAAMRGITFDRENAYKSALKNASVVLNSGSSPYVGRANLNTSVFLGYTPGTGENLSWAIEGYINDYGISTFAKTLRDASTPGSEAWNNYNSEYQYYESRAKNYVNVFNPNVNGWLRQRNANGGWSQTDTAFNPLAWLNGYTEQNAYNYCVTVPQDGRGIANLYGGKTALGNKIDTIFNTRGDINAGGYGGTIHEMLEAREGKMGQFGFNNQPSHHIPYMYLYTDRPWKTAEVVRDIMNRQYVGQDIGQGYLGDEDNGELSMWYVMSSLGIYPVNMGSGTFAIGSPLFTKAVIKNDLGQETTIIAPQNSAKNIYVQGVKIDDVAYDKTYFEHSVFTGGKTIEFEMGPTPSTTWGLDAAAALSLTNDDNRPDNLSDMITGINESLTPSTSTLGTGTTKAAYTPSATNGVNLFNNNSGNATTWASSSANIYVNLGKACVINMYTITNTSTANRAPTAWTLYGSNDATSSGGGTWVQIDQRTGQTWNWVQYTRPYSFNNSTKYQYYRLQITGSQNASNLNIAEFELLAPAYSTLDKSDLLAKIEEARAIDEELYGPDEYLLLTAIVNAGQAVYDTEFPEQKDIFNAIDSIDSAINALIPIRKAYESFIASEYNFSSGSIKAETTNASGGVLTGEIPNIGGSEPGAYMGYKYMDFGNGDRLYTRVRATYAGVESDCPDAHMIVHLDSLDGPVIADISTPPTGTTWNNYQYGYGDVLTPSITGIHKVYIELQSAGKHVANINSFVFEYDTPSPWIVTQENSQVEDELTINAILLNGSSKNTTVKLTAAVYTAEGKLVLVDSSDVVLTANSRKVADPIVLNLEDAPEGHKIKLFAWDETDLKPLVPAIIVK